MRGICDAASAPATAVGDRRSCRTCAAAPSIASIANAAAVRPPLGGYDGAGEPGSGGIMRPHIAHTGLPPSSTSRWRRVSAGAGLSPPGLAHILISYAPPLTGSRAAAIIV